MKRSTVDKYTTKEIGLEGSLSRVELEQWQLQEIGKTLQTALSSRFYRQLYRQHICNDTIQIPHSFAEFSRLPFIDVGDIRQQGSHLYCLSQSHICRIFTLQTSGSTGQPKRIPFTAKELNATTHFFALGMNNLLYPKERVLILLPTERQYSVGQMLLNTLTANGHTTVVHWPPTNPTAMASVAIHNAIDCVVGLPQHVLSLAEILNDSKEKHHVRTTLLNSDYAPIALRKRIERCGITTFLHYGSTESGFGGGVECDAHNGCHLRGSDMYVEVIDPDNGSILPEGKKGEIVLTTLRRRAMPLIRYRTGDFARLCRKQCRCGGVTARLLDICRPYPRSGCIVNGSRLFSHQLDELFFASIPIFDYRAMVTPDGLRVEYNAREEIARETFPQLPYNLNYEQIRYCSMAELSSHQSYKRKLHSSVSRNS